MNSNLLINWKFLKKVRGKPLKRIILHKLYWTQRYSFENKKHEAQGHKKAINFEKPKIIFKFPLFKALRDKPRFHNEIIIVENTKGEDSEIPN